MKKPLINGTIYLWENKRNGKCYAGLTVRPVEKSIFLRIIRTRVFFILPSLEGRHYNYE